MLFKRKIEEAKRKIRIIQDVPSYCWVFIGIFLSLWLLLILGGSTNETALAWALLGVMLLGLSLVAYIIIFKRVMGGGAPETDIYWPEQGASEIDADEWMADMQKGRQSPSQIDSLLNKYRNNPDQFDLG